MLLYTADIQLIAVLTPELSLLNYLCYFNIGKIYLSDESSVTKPYVSSVGPSLEQTFAPAHAFLSKRQLDNPSTAFFYLYQIQADDHGRS